MIKYHIIHKISVYKRWGKFKQGGEQDKESTQQTFTPVPLYKWTQIVETGIDSGISVVSSNTIPGQFPGKTLFKISKPVIHVFFAEALRFLITVHGFRALSISSQNDPVRLICSMDDGIAFTRAQMLSNLFRR